MSDVQGIYRQSQPTPSPFPPYPYFELRARDAVYLLVPRSVSTAGIKRFAMFGDGNGMPQDFIGKLRFEHLLDDLKNGYSMFGSGTVEIGTIRNFYMSWRHVASMEQTPALIDRLKRDIEQGSLVVFRFQSSPHWAIMRQTPGEPVPAASGPVSTWDGRQKVIAMFKAIPSFLQGAAKAEFEAFLTPENLAIMAAFLGGIAVMQAVPGADAAVDALIAGIAWWQFGWAGVVAGKDFVDAVIKAGRATSNDEIMLAAKLAAAALVSLGLTLLLKKITENVHEVRPAKDEPPEVPQPKPPSGSTDDMMHRYQSGNRGVSYPRVDDQFTPESSYDPANLTADQKRAINNLRAQGWNSDKIDQVLNSGSNFNIKPLNPGDPVFKIGNTGLDPAASPSPYLLDGDSYNSLVDQGYIGNDGTILDRAGIKQSLALPCYNLAETIVSGAIKTPTTAVVSDINPASELFTLIDGTGTPLSGQLLMNGGGSQAAIDPSAINW